MQSRLRTALVCCASTILAACAGDGPVPQTSSAWFDVMQREIFDQSCTSGPCHNPQTVAGGLVLTEGVSFDSLVDAIPQNPTAQGDGLLRVRPFELDASFLLNKIEGPGPGEGNQMPLGGEPLSQSEIQFVRDWIAAGAPGPGTPGPGTPILETPTPGIDPSETPTPTAAPDTPTATPATEASPTSTAPLSPSPTPSAVEPTSTPTVTLQQVQDQIFTPSCATQFCHSGDFPSAQLNLEDGKSFDQLVGVTPSNSAAATAGLLRVTAGAPDDSFLMTKIVGPSSIELGTRMPLVGDPLTPEQIDLVRSWIESLSATP